MGNVGVKMLIDLYRPWPVATIEMNSNPLYHQNQDIEGKELKQQLSDKGLYDEGMSIEEMTARIEFIQQSANQASNSNINATEDLRSLTNEIEVASSTSTSRFDKTFSSSKRDIREEKNENENKSPCSKNHESNAYMYDWHPNETANNNFSMDNVARTTSKESVTSRNSLTSSLKHDTNNPVSHSINIQRSQSYSSRLSCKLTDTYDVFSQVLNDVPLKTRFERKSHPKTMEEMPKSFDEILAEKLIFLTEMENLAYKWKTKSVGNEFSWGPPIKVDVANGRVDSISLYKESRSDPQSTTCQKQMITRKANATSYSLRSTQLRDDNNEYADKVKNEKVPKLILNKCEIPPSYELEKTAHHKLHNQKTNIEASREILDHDIEYNDIQLNDGKQAKFPTSEHSEGFASPSRIMSPIPLCKDKSKEKNLTVTDRPKKRSATHEEKVITKSISTLSNEQIEDLICSNDEFEAKNTTVLLPTQRINQSMDMLKRARLSSEEEKKIREEKIKFSAQKETRAREEKAELRKKEREAAIQQSEVQEKLQKDKEDRYRNVTNITRRYTAKTYQIRFELESEGSPPRRQIDISTDEKIDQPYPVAEEINMFPNEKFSTTEFVENVETPECPICRKKFPLAQIENHASNCNDFLQDDGTNMTASSSLTSSSSKMFICKVCGHEIQSKLLYDEHIPYCINSLTEDDMSTDAASSNSSSRAHITSTQDSEMDIDENEIFSKVSNKKERRKSTKRRRKC